MSLFCWECFLSKERERKTCVSAGARSVAAVACRRVGRHDLERRRSEFVLCFPLLVVFLLFGERGAGVVCFLLRREDPRR